MNTPGTVLVGFLAFAGSLAGGVVFIPPREIPRVELISVEYDDGLLVYTREVNHDGKVRAPYSREIIDLRDEASVELCANTGRADYGPDEPRVQSWPLDAECLGALETGVKYEVVATVSPAIGPPTEARSHPFTVSRP